MYYWGIKMAVCVAWWYNFSTFALRFGGRGFRFEGRGKERDVDGEMANKKNISFLFAEEEKFPTFAVPNETGADGRSS